MGNANYNQAQKSKRMPSKVVPICQIFIPQQINLEENGFLSLFTAFFGFS